MGLGGRRAPRARRTLKEGAENTGQRAWFLFHPRYFPSANKVVYAPTSDYGSYFLLQTLHMVGSKTICGMNEIITHTPEPYDNEVKNPSH